MPRYITPDGYRKLAAELERLWKVERPRVTRQVADAAALGDRSENAEYIYGKKRLREIDGRVHFLSQAARGARGRDARRRSSRAGCSSAPGSRSRTRTARASSSGSSAPTSSIRRSASSAWSRRWRAPCSASRRATRPWWCVPREPAASRSCACGIRRARRRSGRMSVCAVTGSASGIGAAIRRRLEKDGARVIGVDLRDAEVVADLGTPAGREAAVAGVLARCDEQARSAGGRGGHRHARAAALARGLGELLRRGRPARRALRGAAPGHARRRRSPWPRTRRSWRPSTRART